MTAYAPNVGATTAAKARQDAEETETQSGYRSAGGNGESGQKPLSATARAVGLWPNFLARRESGEGLGEKRSVGVLFLSRHDRGVGFRM